jgi:dTDP-4-dehydrorhamnose reductase
MVMRILILGANGMLGSQICSVFSNTNFQIYATTKKDNILEYKNIKLIKNINVRKISKIIKLIKKIKPKVVINCTGFIKQKQKSKKQTNNIHFLNGVFPVFLDNISVKYQFHHIHFSTDCVFDGKLGMYNENSVMNAKDDYGKSKIFAEQNIKNNTIVFRTSIIGHEINKKKYGLLEWFLNSSNIVSGYSNVYFSGLTTNELSNILVKIIKKKKFFYGIYNVSSKRISKFNLLFLINKIYNKNKTILKDKKKFLDRSLNSKLFSKIFNLKINTWKTQIEEMHYNYNTINETDQKY